MISASTAINVAVYTVNVIGTKLGLPTDVRFKKVRKAPSERARKMMTTRIYRRVLDPFGFGEPVKPGSSLIAFLLRDSIIDHAGIAGC
jgi:hypothetical protein